MVTVNNKIHHLCLLQTLMKDKSKSVNIRSLSGKFVDTTYIFNRSSNAVNMNISKFAKIFHEQLDEIL